MVEHAANGGAALAYKFTELVEDSYYCYGDEDDDDTDLEEIDNAFLDMMQLCVKYDLIGIEDAVECLYGIHTVGIVDSVLHDKDYVRDVLMSWSVKTKATSKPYESWEGLSFLLQN